jgi:hypothetical protein
MRGFEYLWLESFPVERRKALPSTGVAFRLRGWGLISSGFRWGIGVFLRLRD